MAIKRKPEEMTEEEIAEENGEPLPDREAMSTIRVFEPVPVVFEPTPGDTIEPPPNSDV
jgi:hypothetical protein